MRGRTTLGATIVVAVALAIGAVSFYGILSASIHSATERSAEQRLDELSERLDQRGGREVDRLEDEIVQIIGGDGSVRAASEDARDELGSTALPVSDGIGDDDTLVLAVSIEDDSETLSTVATLLTVAVPLLLQLAVTGQR